VFGLQVTCSTGASPLARCTSAGARPGSSRAGYANPYPVRVHGAAGALRLYREHLAAHPELVAAARLELAGRDVACWRMLPAPGEADACHAAVLLAAVNAEHGSASRRRPGRRPRTGRSCAGAVAPGRPAPARLLLGSLSLATA
jgi:hypothetical protein